MNSKWLYGALFVLLVSLGVQMDRNLLSKQEIALQFTEQGFNQDNAQLAISEVKTQLLGAGATDIQIIELEAGQLKITYSSKLSVTQIQQLLTDAGLASHQPLETPQTPDQDELTAYQLDVYELQESGTDLDIEGAPVVEVQVKEHLTVPSSAGFFFAADFDLAVLPSTAKAQITFANDQLKSRYAYLLPEVRAGPLV
ncbi:hypothetical protein [Gilvibacter sediminis]|uniref:hypothetical protein n=1 Tax=Gilvibacter sediminis TaxID=379071 RepID=UPI00234FB938|nr:hypothetical protein [Gilvibacter sediminis]MDC7997685.1 hypothetical protein [Gilvibacter sediminis]